MLNKIIPIFVILFFSGILLSQDNPFYAPGNPDQVNLQSHNSFLDTNLSVQGVWSRVNDLPKSLIGVNSYYDSLTNKIFICGGLDQNSVPNDTCWWYDIAANTYQQAAYLPQGRWSGKLVKVKNNLYLVGSIGSSFNTPDGIIYKYSVLQNLWSIADTMPAPFVHEPAVCVFNDSLIITIGGSTNGYSSPKNYTRIFDPQYNTWKNSTSFPINITTSHAEINTSSIDTTIFVAGGYNAGNLNTFYQGSIYFQGIDTINISWLLYGSTPFPTGIYRVAGAKWKDYMLFGPGMNIGVSVNNIWGFSYNNGIGYWTAFNPTSNDTVGNISTFSAITGIDSNYFYLFGGFKNPNTLNIAQKYSFTTPPPIGIINLNQTPKQFKLYQNYPNPFNPVTKIKFDLPSNEVRKNSAADLLVYDILGKLIAQYKFTDLNFGSYEIELDGSNLPSGVYFYKLVTEFSSQTKKMILLK